MDSVRAAVETSFVHDQERLVGDVVVPASGMAATLVVFVEGSGPGGRDQGRWPDRLAHGGVASLAYDKPGCGESSGSWTDQSIEDRAGETVAAVQHGVGLGFERVALIGFSQGGWVARLAGTRSDLVDVVVTVSGPAVDVASQERFRLRSQLPADGVAPADVQAAIELFEWRCAQLAAGHAARAVWTAEIEQRSQSWYQHSVAVTAEELEFIARVLSHDPIPAIRQLRQPLLSVFGGDDRLVDVDESVGVLHALRPATAGDRIVVVPGVDHSLRMFTGPGPPDMHDGHYQPGALAAGVVSMIADWIDEHTR